MKLDISVSSLIIFNPIYTYLLVWGIVWPIFKDSLFIHIFNSSVYEEKDCRQESDMEDRWLSVDEIATYIGIKRDTVYKWIGDKKMPAHRMGRLWKFKRDEVDEWVLKGGASEEKDGGAQVAD